MSKKYTCVSIYKNHQAAEKAIENFQKLTSDIKMVSILGKGFQDFEHPVGFYSIDDNIHFQGKQDKFWSHQWQQMNGASFFWLPDFGPLAAAGPIVNLLVGEDEPLDLVGGMNVLGLALFKAGIPVDSVKQYENAVKNGLFILIVQGLQSQVERACKILHSKTQQVTVHIA